MSSPRFLLLLWASKSPSNLYIPRRGGRSRVFSRSVTAIQGTVGHTGEKARSTLKICSLAYVYRALLLHLFTSVGFFLVCLRIKKDRCESCCCIWMTSIFQVSSNLLCICALCELRKIELAWTSSASSSSAAFWKDRSSNSLQISHVVFFWFILLG